MPIKSLRKRFTPAQREIILAAYRQGSLTQKQCAAQAGISLSCLQSWLRKAQNTAPAALAGFVEIPRPPRPEPLGLASSFSPSSYHLRWPGGPSLEAPRGFAPEEVASLCGILKSL